MKAITKTLIVLIYLGVNYQTTKAQNNLSDTTELDYKDKFVLAEELGKFGLKAFEFTGSDPCYRTGKPIVKKDPYFTPAFPSDSNPVIRFKGDSNATYMGKGPDDINIIWIHGLNGSTESLAVPAIATQFGVPGFPARKARSIRGTTSSTSHAIQFYSEDHGISAAAGDMENALRIILNNGSESKPADFIIAHSQGGIVAREWLRKMEKEPNEYKPYAHGLVTIGTSHGGAQILNNTRPNLGNKVPAFMNEACTKLSAAIIEPITNKSFLTQLLISNNMTNVLIDKSCALLSNTIIPFALDNYYKRTTEDYYVGSPFLTGSNSGGVHTEGLSEYTLKVPVVQFYGEEEQPVLWRFMSSTMGIGHDKINNTEANFGYDKDDDLYFKVLAMVHNLQAHEIFAGLEETEQRNKETKYNRLAIMSLFTPASTGLIPLKYLAEKARKGKESARENRLAYEGAKVWLINANDYYLTDIVGARVNEVTLNCRVIADLDCIDPQRNPVLSGIPPVKVKLDYNYNTGSGNCNVPPVNIAYANYSFPGPDHTMWQGACTGNQTVIPTWRITHYYKPNDGVVLTESSNTELKVNTDVNPANTYARVYMPRTNHEQMKNCTETKKALVKLYDGKTYGRFFKVDPR